jgi:hypothetical protein
MRSARCSAACNAAAVQPQQPVQQGGYVQMPSNNQMPQANPAGFNSFYGTQTVAPGFSSALMTRNPAAVKKNRKAREFRAYNHPLPFIALQFTAC